MPQPPFANQWVAITGASKGLGKAMAMAFARAGAKLLLNARHGELLDEIARKVETENRTECVVVAGDLTKESDLIAFQNLCVEKEIDILINNAGIVWIKLLEEVAPADIDRLLTLNLAVPIKLTRAVIPLFKKRKSGTIVNINSAGGKKPVPEHTLYCASKYGVNGFAESLKLEVKGYGIRIVNVSPGKMATELFAAAGCPMDMSTFIPPEEVAESLVSFLQLSERCSPTEIAIDRMS